MQMHQWGVHPKCSWIANTLAILYMAIVWLVLLMFTATQIIVALCNNFLDTTRTTFSDDSSKI